MILQTSKPTISQALWTWCWASRTTVIGVTQIDGLRRYIDAATTLTQITRGRAEELVRELVASGEVERVHAQEWIDDLVKRSREASENLMHQVSSEVERQLGDRGVKRLDVDDLAERVAGIIGLAQAVGRNVAHGRSWDAGTEHNGHNGTGDAKAGAKQKAKSQKTKDPSKKSSDKKKKDSSVSAKAPKAKSADQKKGSKKDSADKDSAENKDSAEQKATT